MNTTKVMFWRLNFDRPDTPEYVAEINGAVHPDGTVHILFTNDGLQAIATLFTEAIPLEQSEEVASEPAVKTTRQRKRSTTSD